VQQAIEDALRRIEAPDQVRVLFAVESGSRAWGFASRDSDWDVRFVYIRRPAWYLSVQRRRDVLEYRPNDGLDVSGWDVKKALGLFAKSNPPLLEWLRSPIVYREAFSVADTLRALSARYFSPRSCMHHYLHMAEGNYREYLQGDPVRVKKYFYVLRPVLACKWIAAHGTMPPTEFAVLVDDQLPTALRPVVHDLLARKRAGDELASGPRIPAINEFLDSEMAGLGEALAAIPRTPAPDWEALDRVFRDGLHEVWGGVVEQASLGADEARSSGR
jgi:predicted nucleotidyltransferase